MESRTITTAARGKSGEYAMAGLREFHHEDASRDKTTRIVAWVVIAILIGGFGVYVAESGFFNANHTTQNYPRGL
jgi:hypothetical protein